MAEVMGSWVLTQTDKMKVLFGRNAVNGYLEGPQAANLLAASRLPIEVLAQIWDLADKDADGRLDENEFVLAFHLCVCVTKRGLPLPQQLPEILERWYGDQKSRKLPKFSKGDKVIHSRSSDGLQRKGVIVGVHADDIVRGFYYTVRLLTEDQQELQANEERLRKDDGTPISPLKSEQPVSLSHDDSFGDFEGPAPSTHTSPPIHGVDMWSHAASSFASKSVQAVAPPPIMNDEPSFGDFEEAETLTKPGGDEVSTVFNSLPTSAVNDGDFGGFEGGPILATFPVQAAVNALSPSTIQDSSTTLAVHSDGPAGLTFSSTPVVENVSSAIEDHFGNVAEANQPIEMPTPMNSAPIFGRSSPSQDLSPESETLAVSLPSVAPEAGPQAADVHLDAFLSPDLVNRNHAEEPVAAPIPSPQASQTDFATIEPTFAEADVPIMSKIAVSLLQAESNFEDDFVAAQASPDPPISELDIPLEKSGDRNEDDVFIAAARSQDDAFGFDDEFVTVPSAETPKSLENLSSSPEQIMKDEASDEFVGSVAPGQVEDGGIAETGNEEVAFASNESLKTNEGEFIAAPSAPTASDAAGGDEAFGDHDDFVQAEEAVPSSQASSWTAAGDEMFQAQALPAFQTLSHGEDVIAKDGASDDKTVDTWSFAAPVTAQQVAPTPSISLDDLDFGDFAASPAVTTSGASTLQRASTAPVMDSPVVSTLQRTSTAPTIGRSIGFSLMRKKNDNDNDDFDFSTAVSNNSIAGNWMTPGTGARTPFAARTPVAKVKEEEEEDDDGGIVFDMSTPQKDA